MAKIKVRPHPGALSELLKKLRMTQVDASEKTRVDRKTLSKIERGEEVKLETLQQVATKLQVTEGYFSQPAAAVAVDASDAPSELEPGTIMLRKLDAARLEELLRGVERLEWQLNAKIQNDEARKLLEEFETSVENFRKHHEDPFRKTSSLRLQLDALKKADDLAARLEQLAEHGLALLGADFLFWKCTSEDGEYEDRRWTTENYLCSGAVLLSVEPANTQSRRVQVFQGSLPPQSGGPDTDVHRIHVVVNGRPLPALTQIDDGQWGLDADWVPDD